MMDAASAPEETVSIGLLLETAQSHQELAEASLRRLQAHTAGLDEVVRDAVGHAAIAEFAALSSHGDVVVESLRRLHRAVNLRSVWAAALLAVVPAAMAALAVWYWAPGPAQLAVLRTQQAALQDNLARLAAQGGRVDLRRCGDTRLCVRVDRRAPSFGEHADYLVVQGY